jgi:multimeric flavodoxin WrbA
MKFLIINASPNENGVTVKFCDAFTKAAEKVGEVKRLNLHDDPPPFCRGILPRPRTLGLYQREVLDCDALFVATPTYWFNVPSILKAFIEELDPIEEDLWEKRRAFGAAIHAPEGGELGPATALILPLNHLNFSLVNMGYVYHRGIPKDDWAWEDINEMPARMASIING